jgi:tRNA(fMet)-specific endonuclease VapC
MCIYIIKQRPTKVFKHFATLRPTDVCISSVAVSELFAGVEKSAFPDKNKAALEQFLLGLDILSYGLDEAKLYGQIRASLERVGMPIGPYDLMIAAHCISSGCALVTNNIKEFERVPKLTIENWV